jgi:hypothetical protein
MHQLNEPHDNGENSCYCDNSSDKFRRLMMDLYNKRPNVEDTIKQVRNLLD